MFQYLKRKLIGGGIPTPTLSKPPCVKIVEDTTKIQKPKTKTYRIVTYKSLLNGVEFCGVVLKTVTHEKAKSSTTHKIHIVSIFKDGGHEVTPYLKWINDSYCTHITEKMNLNYIDSKYFDYDWMVDDAEKKRLKGISSKISLQESDGGEISA